MEKEKLTLRSIYRFLTVNDFPDYSEGIIGRERKKGLTLTKFWESMLCHTFKEGKYGKMLFRTTGGRNRYLSDICNRSERLGCYEEYTTELLSWINCESMLEQIQLFSAFLLEAGFHYDAFEGKLGKLIPLFMREDECFTMEISNFFLELSKAADYIHGKSIHARAFYCGYVLSELMFHALFGPMMNSVGAKHFRENEELSLRQMWKRFVEEAKEERDVLRLTKQNGGLCGNALDVHHFFGREEELFDMRGMLEKGGYYLFSGVGGIGKTEMMRQFLAFCEKTHAVDCIATVICNGNLRESMIDAFLQYREFGTEGNLNKAFALLRKHKQERVLLVIDNLTEYEEEVLEEVTQLPVTVFVTSRHQKLPGFQTVVVKSPTKRVCEMIFCDNYGKVLVGNEREQLMEFLQNPSFCHTLIMRVLGKTAALRSWSVIDFFQKISQNISRVQLDYQNSSWQLEEIYKQIYQMTGLCEEEKRWLRQFARFPYGSYSAELLDRIGFSGNAEGAEDMLAILVSLGWLEQNENEYSMHPFISECLKSYSAPADEMQTILEKICLEITRCQDTTLKEGSDVRQENMEYWIMLGYRILGSYQQELPELHYRTLFWLVKQMKYYGLFLFAHENNTLVLLAKKNLKKYPLEFATVLMWSNLNEETDFTSIAEKYRDLDTEYAITYEDFLSVYIANLLYKGREEEANAIVAKISKNTASKSLLLTYYFMGVYYTSVGNYPKTLDCYTHGREIAISLSEEGMLLFFDVHSINYLVALRRLSEVEFYIREIEQMTVPWEEDLKSLYLRYAAMYYVLVGQEEKAVENIQEVMKHAELLYNENSMDYFACLDVYCFILEKSKRYKEALFYYDKLVDGFSKLATDEVHIIFYHKVLNNYGVVYLESGDAGKAYEIFLRGYEVAKKIGGIALGEAANNLSKSLRVMERYREEKNYLKEAIPILEAMYGAENPKVTDAYERFNETHGKKKSK